MRRISVLAAAMAAAAMVWAANDATIATRTANGERSVEVEALTDNIIKVTNRTAGEKLLPSKTTVKPSGAFTGESVQLSGKKMLHTGTGVTVLLDEATGEVTISGSRGKGLYDSGLRGVDSLQRRTLELVVPDGRAFHGAGERGYSFNLASDTLVVYNRQNYGYTDGDPRIRQMNISMPLLVSPRGYAVLFDDFAAAEMVAGDRVTYATESRQPVTYYFVNSPEGFAGISEQLSDLTGRQPLPPFWSLGYITSKYGYRTQAETDSVVRVLKRDGYPLDGIVLDLYWYGQEEDMGRLEWDKTQWPNHRKMLAGLKKEGVNLVAISQPYILRNGRGVDNYNELSAGDMLVKNLNGEGAREVTIWVGEGGMFDVSNPDTRRWLRNRYRTLTDEGITGWWGDLGEPEVHPDSSLHSNGLLTREYHNLYGNDWSSIIAELFAEEYPDRRLMTLMRGGTTGLQRYSVFPWSTDVSRSWGGLQPQVKIMLNSGLSGLGYMSHDVGGFAIDPDDPYQPELYVRWLQLGVFSPVLRTHAQRFAEPFHYPELKPLLLDLIKTRYRWLPYNYTLAYENATKGLPMVRPIGMYSPEPERYSDVEDEYLWGRDVLIAPVMTKGATSREVVFPEGRWVDINNPELEVEGPTRLEVAAPLEVLPMYARQGALLPKADYRMRNVGDYNPADYTIDYYLGTGDSATSTSIYEDDRQLPDNLAKNRFALLDLEATSTAQHIDFLATLKGSYPGMPAKRVITFVLHNVANPASVTADMGYPATAQIPTPAKFTSSYDAATRTLTLRVRWTDTSFPLSVSIAR